MTKPLTPEQRERGRLYASMRYHANKEKAKERVAKYRLEAKVWKDNYKLEHGCCDCSYKGYPEALDFDHTDGKSRHIDRLNSVQLIQFEIAIHKCVVRCARCHQIKTFEERAEIRLDTRYERQERELEAAKWRADYKLRLGCYDCGWREHHAALDFHHRGAKSRGIADISSIDAMEREISEGDCIVICANCHRIHHAKERRNG